jgi:hypothetical protein
MRALSDTKGTIFSEITALWHSPDANTIRALETRVHNELSEKRLNGEWFEDESESICTAIRDIAKTDIAVRELPINELPNLLGGIQAVNVGRSFPADISKKPLVAASHKDVTSELVRSYELVCQLLPKEPVTLNENGPYVFFKKNTLKCWLEPRKAGIRLNYWAKPDSAVHSTMLELIQVDFDGLATLRDGTGKNSGQVNFSLCPASLNDLKIIIEAL